MAQGQCRVSLHPGISLCSNKQQMVGKVLSERYEIQQEIGRGGMGTVYLANDPVLSRKVAIKVISPGLLSPETIDRFHREARIIASMDHPSIVGIYDVGKHEGMTYLIMPYVDGKNLRPYILERSLGITEILDIGIQVAEALDYSHERGVVHRDIKPENILLSRNEDGDLRARITDFGLARETSEQRLTQSDAVVGTIGYLSPEQIFDAQVGPSSDIYALATVLYECICGDPPFWGELNEMLYRIVHESPLPLRQKAPEIDPVLETFIMNALCKEPEKRPERAKFFAQALAGCKAQSHPATNAGNIPTIEIMRPAQFAKSAMVSRKVELAEIQQRLNSAIKGDCQFVLLGGEQGVGKSRILQEVETLARVRKVQVLHGRFVGEEQGLRYQGFCEAIQEFFRRSGLASSPSVDFSDLAPDLRKLFPVLGEIGEIRSNPSSDFSGLSQANDTTAVYDLLARAMIRIAAGKPLLLLFEELHCGGESADALQYIIRRMGLTPAMILATYRSNEIDKRHLLTRLIGSFEGDSRFLHVMLRAFNVAEQRTFLENLLETDQLDELFLRRIDEITEGNPFFIKELVRSLLDTRGIVQDDTGRWMLATEIGGPLLPATIQQTVEKRIQDLTGHLHELLSAASVLGKNFSSRDLQLLTHSPEMPEEQIEQLIQKGFLEEDRLSKGDLFVFSNGVLREVIYTSMPRSKRKSYHRRYAEYLEKKNAGKLDRVYPELVHHFLQGDVPPKIVQYGIKLAQKSVQSFSAVEAIRAARMVLDYLEEGTGLHPAVEAEARMILATAYRMNGNFQAALKELKEALGILKKEGEPEQITKGIVMAAETAWAARKVEETLRWIESGLTAARTIKSKESLLRLLSLAATVCNLQGDYAKAEFYLTEAAQIRTSNTIEEQQQRGGSLVVAIPYAIPPLHPVELKLDEEAEILANAFEQLIKMDSDGNIIPWLCEKWESSSGNIFCLTLRKNVAFHDGTRLTAEEVSESFHRAGMLAPYNIPAAFAAIRGLREFISGKTARISGIHVLRPDKLEIHLNESIPIFPVLLTELRTAIVREVVRGGIRLLIGTGPFYLSSYVQQSLELKRNEHYWRGNSSFVDALVFRGGLTAAEIGSGFKKGEYDLIRDLLPEDLEELLRHRPLRATLAEATKKNVYFLLFNIFSPISRSVEVRRSLSGVIRKQDLVRRTIGRFAQPADGLYPPGILGHDPQRRSYPMPPAEAIQLLRSAQMLPLKIKASVHPVFQDRYAAFTSSLFELWREIGVEVKVETPTMDSFLNTLRNNEGIDILIGRWIGEYDDPDSFTYGLFHSKAGDRSSFLSSPELDQWIETARAESRGSTRERLYRKIESNLLDSAAFCPLFHEIDFRLGSPRLRNLVVKNIAPYVNYGEVMKMEAASPVAVSARSFGGSLEIPIAGMVDSLDPSLVCTAVESQVTPAIFETLFRQSEGSIVPWLLEKFEILNGGSRFWFRLRANIRFHDGRRLTARDVRYSLERLLLNPKSDSRYFFAPIQGATRIFSGGRGDLEGIQILSETDFVINLEERISFFPALLAYYSAAIVAEGSEEFGTSWKQGCAGTGPYRVVAFQANKRLELEANPYYWNSGYPRNDRIVFTFGLTAGEVYRQFVAGNFSVAWDLLPADVEALLSDRRYAFQHKETPRLCTYFAAFNTHRGVLADESIRQSLVRSIDVEKLIRKNLGRLAIPACGIIPPGLIGYQPQSEKQQSTTKVKRFGNDRELTCAMNPIYSGPYAAVAKDLFARLSQAGFSVRVINLKKNDYTEFHELLDLAEADFALGRWVGDYPDPNTFASILNSQQKIAGKFCGSPEIDRLIAGGRTEPDPSGRSKIYSEMERLLQRQFRILSLFHEQVFCFASPNIEGFELNFFSPIVAYEKLSLSGSDKRKFDFSVSSQERA